MWKIGVYIGLIVNAVYSINYNTISYFSKKNYYK